MAVVAIVAAALAGVLCGLFLLPLSADWLLKRSYRRSRNWWWESFEAFEGYCELRGDTRLKKNASGLEGALYIWLQDAVRQAEAGLLPKERWQALCDAGVSKVPPAECATYTEQEQEERCSFEATVKRRIACGVLLGLTWSLLAALLVAGRGITGIALAEYALILCCTFFMAVAILCDLSARIIPLECCLAVALFGVVFQGLVGGIYGVLIGMAVAALVMVMCYLANRFISEKGSSAVGQGDMRLMVSLSLLCGPGSAAGALVCYVAAAAVSMCGIAASKLSLKSGIPMAPFLALWMVVGSYTAIVS